MDTSTTSNPAIRVRSGGGVYMQSIRLVKDNPVLLQYTFYTVIATLAIFILFFWGGIACYDAINQWLIDWLNLSSWAGWIRGIMNFFFVIGYVVVSFYTFSMTASFVCLPFMDMLGIAVEKKVIGEHEEVPFWQGLISGLKCSALALIVRLAVFIILLPVIFIPLIGPLVYFLINSWFIRYDYLDLPMSRRGWAFGKKQEFLKKNRRAQLLFGIITNVLLLVPFVNIFMIPLATVAGTLFFLRIEDSRQLPKLEE